jgi:phage terminase large subunit-like protein
MSLSLYDLIAQKPKHKREQWVSTLPEDVAKDLAHKPWWFIGRPEQQEPEGDWNVWLILSGRGWGKTRTGGEWLADAIRREPMAPDGTPTQWAIVAPTFGDARDVCVEGPSGFLRAIRPSEIKFWNRSHGTVLYNNGCRVHCFGADNADAGRGLNLAGAWLDEIAVWPYPEQTWTEGLAPALRIGKKPRVVVTTTPKPIKLLRDWTNRTDSSIYITRGSTFDNAKNLSASALTELQARYAGTRTGRQELYGELLEDADGALWTRDLIENSRVTADKLPPFIRVVVAIDPAVTSGENSDETGIVTAGLTADGHYYVLADNTLRETPERWAREAVNAYNEWKADRVVAETNNGGDMVILLLRQVQPNIPTKKLTATRGKRVRAEPISALYEQGRVHHVGAFPKLEDQMVMWTPDSNESPDRLDALVWALTELSESSNSMLAFAAMADFCPNCKMPATKGTKTCPQCNSPMGV